MTGHRLHFRSRSMDIGVASAVVKYSTDTHGGLWSLDWVDRVQPVTTAQLMTAPLMAWCIPTVRRVAQSGRGVPSDAA